MAALEGWGAGENKGKALLAAAQRGSTARIEALFSQGVSPLLTDENGHTALMIAAREGHVDVLKVCVIYAHLTKWQTLLMVSCDVNAKSHTGRTAVLWAAAKGQPEILESLFEHGEIPTEMVFKFDRR